MSSWEFHIARAVAVFTAGKWKTGVWEWAADEDLQARVTEPDKGCRRVVLLNEGSHITLHITVIKSQTFSPDTSIPSLTIMSNSANPTATIARIGADTALGLLYHGIYNEWLNIMRLLSIFDGELYLDDDFTAIETIMQGLEIEQARMKAITSRISRSVLDRIPEAERASPSALLRCLPRYSAAFPIMNLPHELRIAIYERVECDNGIDFTRIGGRMFDDLHPLAHASSTLRQEALPVIFGSLKIVLDAGIGYTAFRQFVQNYDDDCLRNIVDFHITDIQAPTTQHKWTLFLQREKPGTLQFTFLASCCTRTAYIQYPEQSEYFTGVLSTAIEKRGLHSNGRYVQGRSLIDFVCEDFPGETERDFDGLWEKIDAQADERLAQSQS